MNQVCLMGRLTADPEIRYTQGENATCIARYTLAVDRPRRADGKNHMVFNWFQWERDKKDIPKIHPAQKPVNVIKKLVETFTDEGDIVIDPCAGSGTTLRACKELNRSCYGFEIHRLFYERAVKEMLADKNEQINLEL